MKILFIRFSSIGDIVLTTPVIRNLKNQLDGVEIHYCTKDKFKSLLQPNPYIDKIHVLGESLKDLTNELKQENFDFVIDLHNNIRTLRIKRALGVKSYTFDKLNFKKWLLVNFHINKLPSVHIVDRYMDTLKSFNIVNDGKGLDYFIPEKEELKKSDLPWTHQSGYVAFAIGAQHFTKRLPKEKIVELCSQLSHPIMLLGDKNDTETGDFVVEKLKGKKLIFNACGL